jgi:hypothetical protein
VLVGKINIVYVDTLWIALKCHRYDLTHMVFISHNWFVMHGPVAIILISWNVIFIWETGYWTRAITRFALFDLLKSLYSDTKILSKYIPSLQKRLQTMDFHIVKMHKDKEVNKNVKNIFLMNVWRKSVLDIYFTEFGALLTTVLPVLFKYCYKYCYSDSRKLWGVTKAGGLAL